MLTLGVSKVARENAS